jgi:diguanylate cyclase (GGDEF)-like protein
MADRSIMTALRKEAEGPAGGSGQLGVEPRSVIGAFPGAAALFDASGAVVAANPDAAPLIDALQRDTLPELVESVRLVASEAKPRVARVDLADGDNEKALDVILLPALGEDGPVILALSRESTLERNFISALVASRQLFKDLVSCSADFAWETQSDGALGFISARGALGYSPRELQGRAPRTMLCDPGYEGALPFEWQEPLEDVEIWLFDSSGDPACLLTSSVPVFDKEGVWQGARGVCRDVTEARKQDATLERARNRERLLGEIVDSIRNQVEPGKMLRAAAASTAEALDADHCWILRGGGALGFSGITHSAAGEFPSRLPEVFGKEVSGMGEQREPIELEIDGYRVLGAPSRYRGETNGAIGLARHAPAWDDDAKALVQGVADHLGIAIEQIESHEKLERLARVDELTGLLNRRAFFQDIDKRMEVLRRRERVAALLYVDLDNFKGVNDEMGHERGDEALAALANMLSRGSRIGDLVARMGGDEFAMWLEETDATAAEAKARALLEDSRELRRFSGTASPPLGISVGIAMAQPQSNESLKDLIARADQAMYQVKRGTKGGYAFAPTPPVATRGDT